MDEELRALEREANAQRDARAWLRFALALERVGRAHECLAASRRALALDGAMLDAIELSRRIFVEVARPLPDTDLRAVIGRALGLGGPYEDTPGWDLFQLLAGTFDSSTGAAAWVEDRTRPRRVDPSPVVVTCRTELRIAMGGRRVARWPVHPFNPFFETTVHHLHLEGERAVVVVEHAKSGCLVAVAPFEGPIQHVELPEHSSRLVLPDRVLVAAWRESEQAGEGDFVGGYSLPDLRPLRPVRLRGALARLDWDEFISDVMAGRRPAMHPPGGIRTEGESILVLLEGGDEERVLLRDVVPSGE